MGVVPTAERARVVTGWLLAAFSLLLLASIPVSLSGDVLARPGMTHSDPSGDWFVIAIVAAFTLSGGALVHLRPRNLDRLDPAGLRAVPGQTSLEAYAARALTDPDDSLPLGLLAMAGWPRGPGHRRCCCRCSSCPPLYPTGRPPSRYWRWHVRVSLVGIGLAVAGTGLSHRRTRRHRGRNTPAVGGAGVDDVRPGCWQPLLVAARREQHRGARSCGPAGQRTRTAAAALADQRGRGDAGHDVLPAGDPVPLSLQLIPVAVAIGVLRYGLLGIELALRRTLLYVPLTVMVALVVGGLTTALARLAPEGPLPLLAASAVVAVLLVPVAAWLRRAVDRLVLGERADPLAARGPGRSRSRGRARPTRWPSMLEAVASAADASYAVVRDDRTGSVLAQSVAPGTPRCDVPLRHGGEDLGCSRWGRDRATPPDRPGPEAGHRPRAPPCRGRQVPAAHAGPRPRTEPGHHGDPRRAGPAPPGPARRPRPLAVRHRPRARGGLDGLRRRPRRHSRPARPHPHRGGRGGPRDPPGARRAAPGCARPARTGRRGPRHRVVARHGPARAARLRPPRRLPPLLPPSIEEAAFRIAAESLTNVVRHSGADHCAVRPAAIQRRPAASRSATTEWDPAWRAARATGWTRCAAALPTSAAASPSTPPSPHGHCRHRRPTAGGRA